MTKFNPLHIRRCCRSCFAACCLIASNLSLADHPTLGLQQEAAGSITTLSAITLPKGSGTLGFESQFIANDEISDADLSHYAESDEEVHSTDGVYNISLNAAYGASDNLTLGLNLPYVSRINIREGAHHAAEEAEHPHEAEEAESHAAEHGAAEANEIEVLGDSSGIGDLTLYGQYRFFGQLDSDFHAAALFGVKAPTGKTDISTVDGHLFESEHQPGSGSWDVLTGLIVTRQWSRLTLDSNILYAFANDGSQDTNQGDIFNYNFALSYRLQSVPTHSHHGAHSDSAANRGFWDFAVELNGEWRDQVIVGGKRKQHTGGNIIYVAPSVRYGRDNGFSAYLSVGLPAVKSLNGIQSEPSMRVFAGISFGISGSP